MKYLWHSYKVCKDFEFSQYMKYKWQDYDNNYPNNTLTIDELISTHKDNHGWVSKSPEESEKPALKAEVERLKENQQLAGRIMKNYG